MHSIILHTLIKAGVNTCFNLSRSIDLHTASVKHTNEKAIAGRTQGLIELGEFVTWEAKHFGFTQQLTSHITGFKKPFSFTDEQLKGPFKWFKHQHNFTEQEGGTLMEDIFEFEAPFGLAGRLFCKLILVNYMLKLLQTRNAHIKEVAESNTTP